MVGPFLDGGKRKEKIGVSWTEREITRTDLHVFDFSKCSVFLGEHQK